MSTLLLPNMTRNAKRFETIVRTLARYGLADWVRDWNPGFVKDYSGRCIALALVVEGGQSGGKDASPLAREIIQRCIAHGYIGHANRSN